MMKNLKNIAIFILIAGILTSGYFFLFRRNQEPQVGGLVSESEQVQIELTSNNAFATTEINSELARDFLTLLLSVRGIELNAGIFSDTAFSSLRDSSIILTQDGTEGRPNPFAPIGVDISAQAVTAEDLLGTTAETTEDAEPEGVMIKEEETSSETEAETLPATEPAELGESTETDLLAQ